jgi:hypothetical protein
MRAAVAASFAVLTLAAAPGVAAPGGQAGGHLCPRDAAAEPYDARGLVGLRVRKARAVAARHDCELRVVRRHGESLVVTQDFRTDRINVAVRDRVVRRIVGIY